MEPKNLVAVFEASVKKQKDRPCFRFVENGAWVTLTWEEVRERVVRIAGGLRKLGVKPKDRVCILSKTRCEWTLADLGILGCGAVTVPIYESNTAEQVKFIIEDSQAVVIFVEDKVQIKKVRQVHKALVGLRQIIHFEDLPSNKRTDGVCSLDDLMLLGSRNGEAVYLESVKKIEAEEDASFVYTSGTTGPPKGAILTHRNFIAELKAGMTVFHFEPYYESLLFLPLAHILARVVQFFQLYAGFVQCYAESIDKLLDNIAVARPHFMASVPRIFEKIHTRTLQGVQAGSEGRKKIFEWALAVGRQKSCYVRDRKKVPLWLALKAWLAHRLVFGKLHKKLGGRIRFFISGGAPLSPEVALFFDAFGLKILEGYGLTETTAAIAINRLDDFKIGSVGKPLDGVQIKIAEDGEILVRGDLVFRGYYRNPEATREAINSEGWFHTGDIGEFDEEGFLWITDRKKDIIITAAGKNVAPQNIENLMKSDPYISQFVVHGDKRKFLSALVTLDKDQIKKYAQKHHIPFKSYDELVRNQKIFDLIRQRIEEKNLQLAKYETIKRFAILPNDFSVESGELTPTLKVKRKVISERYREVLDGFYE